MAVGPLDRGKSRLGPRLDLDSRRRLVLAMLDDVLRAVTEAHRGAVFVVTPDPDVDPLAGSHGAQVVRDAGAGTNAAIVAALGDERVAGAAAVLIIQGDLPQLAGVHVLQCLDALGSEAQVAVLVPGDDGGTSALGIRPPAAMQTAFGAQSGQRHREAAVSAGVELRELAITALASDVDTVDDLELVRSSVGPATAAVLQELTAGSQEGAAP